MLAKGDAKQKVLLPVELQADATKEVSECVSFAKQVFAANKDESNLLEGMAAFVPARKSQSPYRQVGEGTCGLRFQKNSSSKAEQAAGKQHESEAVEAQANPVVAGTSAGEQANLQIYSDRFELGLGGQGVPRADSAESERWCQYLCMNAWPHRKGIMDFRCKFAVQTKPENKEAPAGKSDECYLFQGNVDDYIGLPSGDERVVDIGDLKILNRHNVWGLEKSGYRNDSWRMLFSMALVLHFIVVLLLIKWLFNVEPRTSS